MKMFWMVVIVASLIAVAFNMFASIVGGDFERATFFLLSLWFLFWVMRLTDD